MSASRQLTLIHSIQNITKLPFFARRWSRVSSLENAVKTRYKLPHMTVNKATINRHLGKHEPSIDNLVNINNSGIYRVKKNRDYYYYFDTLSKSPPSFPTFKDKESWEAIDTIDSKRLQEYIDHLNFLKSKERPNKRKRLDDIDHIGISKMHEINTNELITAHLATNDNYSTLSYFDSPEAKLLFSPKNNETVKDCLICRESLLRSALTDDMVLDHIVNDSKLLCKLEYKKRNCIRYRCMYLRKLYKNALQYMNSITWKECARKSISELADEGVNYIKDNKSLRRWNIEFRQNEKFILPYSRIEHTPKVFSIFPEAKAELLKFANEKVKLGELSTEAAHTHMVNNVLPKCYNNLISYYNEQAYTYIPSYNDVLNMLQLKNIDYTTTWRWLKLLGFKYSVSGKSYYTDGHERHDVVFDREERFLYYYSSPI